MYPQNIPDFDLNNVSFQITYCPSIYKLVNYKVRMCNTYFNESPCYLLIEKTKQNIAISLKRH